MHCKQARLQLRQNDGRQDQQYTDALFNHLLNCHDCWNIASSLWEREAVGNAAEDPVSSIDVDSALNRAWTAGHQRKAPTLTHSTRSFRHFAAAAMIVVAVSAVLLQFLNDGKTLSPRETATIVATPASVKYVDFMLTSADALDATITLALDDNLILSGYPGMKEVSWMTSLQAGDNQLTLPLQLQNDEDGIITVNVESGGLQKQMMFTVQPSQPKQNSQVI